MGAKLIFAIIGGAAALAGVIVLGEANTKGRRKLHEEAADHVMENRSGNIQAAYDEFDELVKKKSDLENREAFEINERIKSFKTAEGIDKQFREIDEETAEKLAQFKQDHDIEGRERQLRMEYSESLANNKVKIDYDGRIKEQEDLIDEVNRVAKSQKAMNNFVSYNSDYAKSAHEAVSEAIDFNKKETISKAKKTISKIKKEHEDYKKQAHKDLNQKLADLQKEVDDYNSSLCEEARQRKSDLKKLIRDKKEEIMNDVYSKRTDEEKSYESRIDSLFEECLVNDQKEQKSIKDLLKDATSVDYIAAYFKEQNWSSLGVVAVGILPLIPVIGGAIYYINWIWNIVDKMQ